jgi:hypothetical protein
LMSFSQVDIFDAFFAQRLVHHVVYRPQPF